METRANLVTVGLFVLAIIAAAFGSAFWLLRGNDSARQAGLTVVFPGSVSGLVTGANVTFNGIRVGQVAKLSFAPDDPSRVIAQLVVDAETPIKRDARVSLGYQGLTGLATVQIWGGSQGADGLLSLRDPERVMWAERSSVQDIIENAQGVLAKVDAAAGNIEQLIKDNSQPISDTVRNVRAFTDSLSKNAEGIDRFLASMAATGDTLSRVGGRVDRLADDLDLLVRTVDRGKITSIVDHAENVAARLDEASKRVDGLLAGVEDMAKSPEGKSFLVKTTGLIDEATATVKSIRETSQRVDGLVASIDRTVETPEGRGFFSKVGGFLDEATAAAKGLRQAAQSLETRFGELTGGIDRLTSSTTREIRDLASDSRRTLGTIDRAVGNFDRNPNRVIFGGAAGSTPEYQGGRR
jgi:phospholipid/cholesterol/gamma-HCH transport system substrate-binding protein